MHSSSASDHSGGSDGSVLYLSSIAEGHSAWRRADDTSVRADLTSQYPPAAWQRPTVAYGLGNDVSLSAVGMPANDEVMPLASSYRYTPLVAQEVFSTVPAPPASLLQQIQQAVHKSSPAGPAPPAACFHPVSHGRPASSCVGRSGGYVPPFYSGPTLAPPLSQPLAPWPRSHGVGHPAAAGAHAVQGGGRSASQGQDAGLR